MNYSKNWDLTTIPAELLSQEYWRRRATKQAAPMGRPKLPRCAKCGEIKRDGHECTSGNKTGKIGARSRRPENNSGK